MNPEEIKDTGKQQLVVGDIERDGKPSSYVVLQKHSGKECPCCGNTSPLYSISLGWGQVKDSRDKTDAFTTQQLVNLRRLIDEVLGDGD